MLALLLIGCDEAPGTVGGALDVAEEHLEGASAGVAQVGVDAVRVRRVRGAAVWEGKDVATWLAPCGLPPAAEVEIELALEPGGWPWEVLGVDGAGEARPCIEGLIARYPFDEPGGVGEKDVVLVRLGPPDAVVTTGTIRVEAEVPFEPAPPSFRVTSTPDALDLDTLRLRDGVARWRRDGPVQAGTLADAGAVARRLTCAEGAPGLVRVAMAYADGELREVETTPSTGCVEDRVRDADLGEVTLAGKPLRSWSRALVVLDVPVGAW